MKIIGIGYRKWALDIYNRLATSLEHDVIIIDSKERFDQTDLSRFNADVFLFYGWSWRVPEALLDKYLCVMLHPAPLPRYRGGSPLQNQILAGEVQSMVTLFRMNNRIDAGNILLQAPYSLEGTLDEILERISDIGVKLTMQLIRGDYQEVAQDEKSASYCERRTPEQSEITIEELLTKDGVYLYNKIRMLMDPYPNAFIRTKDNKKLILKLAELEQ